MNTYIDPPEGWKYGFPKIVPENTKDVRQWLIDNGYPEAKIKYWENSSIGYLPCSQYQDD